MNARYMVKDIEDWIGEDFIIPIQDIRLLLRSYKVMREIAIDLSTEESVNHEFEQRMEVLEVGKGDGQNDGNK